MSSNPSAPSAPLFFDKVHDEFISKLHDTFIEHYGIEITNIRIESFRIINQELANNISKQAFVTAQTETQLANLSGQSEIATAQQRRDAEVARIKAEGEAVRLKTETDAKNRAILESARVRQYIKIHILIFDFRQKPMHKLFEPKPKPKRSSLEHKPKRKLFC